MIVFKKRHLASDLSTNLLFLGFHWKNQARLIIIIKYKATDDPPQENFLFLTRFDIEIDRHQHKREFPFLFILITRWFLVTLLFCSVVVAAVDSTYVCMLISGERPVRHSMTDSYYFRLWYWFGFEFFCLEVSGSFCCYSNTVKFHRSFDWRDFHSIPSSNWEITHEQLFADSYVNFITHLSSSIIHVDHVTIIRLVNTTQKRRSA